MIPPVLGSTARFVWVGSAWAIAAAHRMYAGAMRLGDGATLAVGLLLFAVLLELIVER
jgi:hypothetical protein